MKIQPKKLKGFKENLPTKICPQCARPFQYRKKWKKVWHEIIYCSQRCKIEAKKAPKNS